MAVKQQKIVADFETTTTPDDVRVWAVCAVDIETGKTVHLSNSIESFFKWLEDKNTVCYFHNLKFDGEFILPYLINNGYDYSEKSEAKTFKTLITDMGLFYSISVCFEKMNKQYKKVVFYDSLKKLPFKVEQIAKAFNLPMRKLSIDYDAPRPVGHELTEEEKDYIQVDCKIVGEALKIQFAQGLKKMTNASDALSNYKETIDKRFFENYFPVLPLTLDADLRRAYKGGFTWLNPKYKEKEGMKGLTLDVNSLYPSVMYNEFLPYSYPMYFEGEPKDNPDFPLFIVRIKCAFDLKPGHIPTIQIKKSRRFIETEYLTTSEGEIVPMTVTSVDLALMKDHYILTNLEYINGYRFKARNDLFKPYIDQWMKIKEESEGAIRQLAKLMLNSLYGKFASNPIQQAKIPYMNDEGIISYKVTDEEEKDPVYTAVACFITAYARNKTIRSAQKVYDRFIYADTDSLHLEGWDIPEGLDIHPTRLGAWKNEGYFVNSKFIRAKTYMETMKVQKEDSLKNYAKLLNNSDYVKRESEFIYAEQTHVTCAGMPDNIKENVTYQNFKTGSTFEGKLIPKRYPGGVILENSLFTIR